jgi:hypothetical protein
MTVETLIALLNDCDPEAEVLTNDNESGYIVADTVIQSVNVKVGKGQWGGEPYIYFDKAVVIE